MSVPRRFPVILLLALAGGGLWFGLALRHPNEAPAGGAPEFAQAAERGQTAALDSSSVRPAVEPSVGPSVPVSVRQPFSTEDPVLVLVADSGVRLPARIDAVSRLLARPLSSFVLAETIAFLDSPVPEEGAALERERALRNSLLNRLRDYHEHASALVPALAAQVADPTQDPGLRDYALQHLAALSPKLEEGTRALATRALRDALQNPEATYAGTSLLGLNDLAKRGYLSGDFDALAEARRIALDEAIDIRSRLTALALAAELGGKDDRLVRVARAWSEPTSPVPEGARRTARAYLKTQ